VDLDNSSSAVETHKDDYVHPSVEMSEASQWK